MSETRMHAPDIRSKFIDKIVPGGSNKNRCITFDCNFKEQFEMMKKLEVGIVTKFYNEKGEYLFSKKRTRDPRTFEEHTEHFIDESIPGKKEILYAEN